MQGSSGQRPPVFGVFVRPEGHPQDALVHASQVNEQLSFSAARTRTRDKVKALEFFAPPALPGNDMSQGAPTQHLKPARMRTVTASRADDNEQLQNPFRLAGSATWLTVAWQHRSDCSWLAT